MQFPSILVIAALAAAVAAPTGYTKPAYEAPKPAYEAPKPAYGEPAYEKPAYEKSTSTTTGYEGSSSDGYGGYAAHHFAAPSIGARLKGHLKHFGHAVGHILGELGGFFHHRWVNLKSDLDRIHWWLHCHRHHFHMWWQWKCQVAAGKCKIRNDYERKIYDSMCELEKTKKSEYDSRVKECQSSGEEYTDEQVNDYVSSAYKESTGSY
jgi:hypothetical protein